MLLSLLWVSLYPVSCRRDFQLCRFDSHPRSIMMVDDIFSGVGCALRTNTLLLPLPRCLGPLIPYVAQAPSPANAVSVAVSGVRSAVRGKRLFLYPAALTFDFAVPSRASPVL
jgi:hypothetical protein